MTSNPSSPGNYLPPQAPAPGGPADDEIDLRDLLAVILGGWKLLAGVAAGVLLLGVVYAWSATRIFEADALIQVELQDKTMEAAFGEIAGLLGGQAPVTAEMEIIKSRMVIGKVVEDLRLEISAEPAYMPLLGRPLARRYRGAPDEVAPAFLGFRKYAWGGESIEISALDVPDALLNAPLELRAAQDGFVLYGPGNGAALLTGVPGERASADTVFGRVEIFVTQLIAAPGTRFEVRRRPRVAAINGLSRSLRVVERGRQSGILAISLEGPDRGKVTEILNAVATVYQRQNVERRSAEAEQTLAFLNEQLPKLKTDLEAAESALNRYRLQRGSADLTKETELVLQQSVELERNRMLLEQRREEALRRYTREHPVIQTIDAQLAQTRDEREAVSARVRELPSTQQELLALARDVQVNTALYTSLLNSAQELEVVRAGTVGNVRIIDSAVVPLSPSKPRVTLLLAVSMMLGLMLGLISVFVRRALHAGVEDPAEVERVLGIPTYAAVPHSPLQWRLERDANRREGRRQILAQVDPRNIAIEALRSLRTSLHFAQLEAENNIIMLTGPAPELGKSFTAINLGAVLATSGKRVVVVDADLRRGHLNEYLDSGRSPGLSDYIAGNARIDEVTHKTVIPDLACVPSGVLPPNPAELLLNERFAELLRGLSQQFDHVLLDTPPVLAVTDAAIVGRHAGCTLLVLKSGQHPIRMIEECARRLQNAGITVRGTVFNQVGQGHSRYGYKYGYGYYHYYGDKAKA